MKKSKAINLIGKEKIVEKTRRNFKKTEETNYRFPSIFVGVVTFLINLILKIPKLLF